MQSLATTDKHYGLPNHPSDDIHGIQGTPPPEPTSPHPHLNSVRPSWNEIAAATVALASTTAVPPVTPNKKPAAVVNGMAGMASTSATTYSAAKYSGPNGPSSSTLATLFVRSVWIAVVAALGPALAVSTTMSKEPGGAPPAWSCSLFVY